MTDAVTLHKVTKAYGDLRAVDAVDLAVPAGLVYGFLGPNGAGKTTTLRMLLGLIHQTSGSVRVLGTSPGSASARSRVGALIEGPAFYPYLSGRDNLRVLARYGSLSRDRVENALGQVELTERAGDRYATYSLGMKQRLGVAAALLKDPELIVLDEPTNGLDPAGIRDMRALVRRLGASGRTVLLSSHLMAEVQQVCDRVAVIDHGRIIAESTVGDLRGHGELVVAAAPSDVARRLLEEHPAVRAVTPADGRLRVQVDDRHAADLARLLVGAGLALTELRREERQLEDVFIEMTDVRRFDERKVSHHA